MPRDKFERSLQICAIVLVMPALVILWTLDDAHVGKLASMVTIVSLIFAPTWYFIKKHVDAADERRRASNNLISELEDALEGLDPKKHDNLRKIKTPDGWIYFMNRMFNHDFYDSLVVSGKINFVDRHIQQPIQDVYHRLRDHNAYLQKIRDIEDDLGGGDAFPNPRYYAGLQIAEKRLLQDIEKTINLLKNAP